MKLRYIHVRCECGTKYDVLTSASKMRQRLILDYAICPACLLPRFMSVWRRGDIFNRCLDCNVPFRHIPLMAQGRCNTCYVYWLRLTKRAPIATVNIHVGNSAHRDGA